MTSSIAGAALGARVGGLAADVLPALAPLMPKGAVAVLLVEAAGPLLDAAVPAIKALQRPGMDKRRVELDRHYACVFEALERVKISLLEFQAKLLHERKCEAQRIAARQKTEALQQVASIGQSAHTVRTPSQAKLHCRSLDILEGAIAASDRQLELAAA